MNEDRLRWVASMPTEAGMESDGYGRRIASRPPRMRPGGFPDAALTCCPGEYR
jgi:hypothetical protein